MTKYSSFISRTKKTVVPVPTGSAVFIINFNVILYIYFLFILFTNFYTCLDLAPTAVQALPVPLPL